MVWHRKGLQIGREGRSYPYHLGLVFAAAQDEGPLPGMRHSSICRGRPAAMGRVRRVFDRSLPFAG